MLIVGVRLFGSEQVSFWRAWHEFEVAHGNEDTFREMLRIKRTVAARFSQVRHATSYDTRHQDTRH